MGIRFRMTRNRREDLLRFGAAGLLFLVIVTIFWNQSSTPLSALSAGYEGYILEGAHRQRILNAEGVAMLKAWLEDRTRPVFNPFTIVRQHQSIGRPDTRYEFAVGMRPVDETAAFREYGVFQQGAIVYLQVEPVGIDRVFRASFTAEELENALMPYIDGDFRSSPAKFP